MIPSSLMLASLAPGREKRNAMAEIRVPTLGESVTEATIVKWFKKAGDAVAVTSRWSSSRPTKSRSRCRRPAAGVLTDIAVKDGDTVAVGALLGAIKERAGAVPTGRPDQKTEQAKAIGAGPQPAAPRERPRRSPSAGRTDTPLAPSVRKIAAETGIDPSTVSRQRQGRPRHQGRHARRHRARRRATDACRRAGGGGADARAIAASMMPRAKSACA